MSDSGSQQREVELLEAVADAPALRKAATYARLSGPGWLQSATTLGSGSLLGSLYLGVIGGFQMMWVQPVAMLMGAILLAAICHVTLSIRQSPFQALRTQVNPVLAWGWLLACQLANMIWVLPQYSLSYAALTENLFPNLFGESSNASTTKYLVSFAILGIMLAVNFLGSGKGRGYRIYENILKTLVAVAVLSFMGVVIRLAGTLDWGAIFRGFVPNFSLIWQPADTYGHLIDAIPDEAAREYWNALVLSTQRDRMVAAAATAVGINMTFLMPWALRARGWGRAHRGLATFDLFLGMMIPFVLATGCVVITAASQFHGQPFEGLMHEDGGQLVVHAESPQYGSWSKAMAARDAAVGETPHSDPERKLAGMLIPRDSQQLAAALESLFGSSFVSQKAFGIGALAMGISTISILMLISGFVMCEITGKPKDSIAFKLGTALAATGALWPLLWTGPSKSYLAVVASTFGYILFPIAFLAFVFMINSKRVLGDQVPRGAKRLAWNIPLVISLAVTGLAAGWTGWGKVLKIKGDSGEVATYPLGKWFIIVFAILVVIGFFLPKKEAPTTD